MLEKARTYYYVTREGRVVYKPTAGRGHDWTRWVKGSFPG